MLLKQAEFLLKELRCSVEIYLKDAKIQRIDCNEKWLCEKRGVFVTLSTYPGHELRGCIGYAEPAFPLGEAALRAAICAACADPRFKPVSAEELSRITFELSVLTKPVPVAANSPESLVKLINIGKDGLIVSLGSRNGLLLPQVASENGLGKEDFLAHCCIKAGLSPGAWKEQGTKIMKFSAEVFSEVSPDGRVIKNKCANI